MAGDILYFLHRHIRIVAPTTLALSAAGLAGLIWLNLAGG